MTNTKVEGILDMPPSTNHGGKRLGAGKWFQPHETEIVEIPPRKQRNQSHWNIILCAVLEASHQGKALRISGRQVTIREGLNLAKKRTGQLSVIHVVQDGPTASIAWVDLSPKKDA